jgi:hypothetical protein
MRPWLTKGPTPHGGARIVTHSGEALGGRGGRGSDHGVGVWRAGFVALLVGWTFYTLGSSAAPLALTFGVIESGGDTLQLGVVVCGGQHLGRRQPGRRRVPAADRHGHLPVADGAEPVKVHGWN